MKIFLAGQNGHPWIKNEFYKFYRLESFYNITKKEEVKINKYQDFLLDSGAFTFMQNKSKKENWITYLNKYVKFIKKHNINNFFELDIDSVVGYKKVKKLREKLEKETNKKCIPVWHKSRGKKEFINLCKKYNYVAIGGIVSGEIKTKDYKYFTWFIKQAHKHNTKIHALGLTSYKQIKKYNFDSVDSTAWMYGNIGGYLYKFNGKEVVKINRPKNKKIKNKKTAQNNFKEWVKFQKWADKNIKKLYEKTSYKKLKGVANFVKKILFLGRNINNQFSYC
jgi:hypothetical protein